MYVATYAVPVLVLLPGVSAEIKWDVDIHRRVVDVLDPEVRDEVADGDVASSEPVAGGVAAHVARGLVYRLVTLGRLRRRGEPNKFRGLLLSDVFHCRDRGEPIEAADAAKVLGGTASDVRRLVAEGKLMLVPEFAAPGL